MSTNDAIENRRSLLHIHFLRKMYHMHSEHSSPENQSIRFSLKNAKIDENA